MQIARLTLAALCTRFGGILKLPSGIDGAKLLWALAGVESSFGVNISPRHEAGYCREGKYFDAAATDQWGCLAHCSYGPWQTMFANCPIPRSPITLLGNMEECANAAVHLIQDHIVDHEAAQTLEEIADAYNSGTWRDALVPEKYIADAVKNYAVPIGELR